MGLVCQLSINMATWLKRDFLSAQIRKIRVCVCVCKTGAYINPNSIIRKTGTSMKSERNPRFCVDGSDNLIIPPPHFSLPYYFLLQFPHFWPDSVCSTHRWEVHPSGEIASSISPKQPPQPCFSLSVTPFSPLWMLQTSERSEFRVPWSFP